ncbi:MAG TPA: signal recognition particle protein [Candidatus Dependentiae bacterium]|nr:signal recognition particle protein [Candidatus Dependentiae bacterium]HRQ62276.1 signal recognition particle protein [Candidatus Dependentiae bacterium]
MFDLLSQKFSSLFSRLTGSTKLTEHNLQETFDSVRDALLDADVPYDVVETFIADVKQEVVGQGVLGSLKPAEQLMKVVNDKLVAFLGGKHEAPFSFQLPSIVLVMGLQGSGKTTTIAKLAHWVQKEAKARSKTRRILVGSVDFYRPAAIDQLEVLANQVQVDFYRAQSTDPVRAAQEIVNHYKQGGYELLLLDTAGRLHVDEAMLHELVAIDKLLEPRYKFLVLDAMTGQESLNVAKAFNERIGFKAAILTKMDSDTRGGAAFAFRFVLQKPIRFVGVGEKIDDLDPFYPERAASRMIGMGDIKSLIERANEKIKQVDQEAAYKSMSSGKMTLQDFADQMDMVSRLGSLSQVVKYIPGMGNVNLSQDMLQKGDMEVKRFKAIISSMTLKERIQPRLLDGSRKNRVAKGAGVTVQEVNLLLQRFEQVQQYAKLFKKRGFFGKF